MIPRAPSDFNIPHNPLAPRLTIAQVVALVEGVVEGKLEVHHISTVQGVEGDEWCEVRTKRLDTLAFFVRDGSVTNCFFARTPSGKEYFMMEDGGSPLVGQPLAFQQKVTKLFYRPKDKEKVEVECVWRVVIRCGNKVTPVGSMHSRGVLDNGMQFPEELRSGNILKDEPSAVKAAARYEAYRKQVIKENKKTLQITPQEKNREHELKD